MAELGPGASIGRYIIDEVISHGGTATVFSGHAADQPELPPVAIKVVDLGEGYRETANEADLLMDLEHPGLPKVYEAFEEDDHLVVIEDLVIGQTLEAYVEDHGPLCEAEVIEKAIQLADILSYLHDRPRKVIHRDLKPSNIINTDRGLVLVDFGIAKVFQAGKDYDTVYAYTQRYASPEQLLNRGTDERSDVYSFGATLAFLATGVPTPPALGQPVAAGHTVTIQEMSPEKLHSAVSERLRALILRCMEFDPQKRYQNFAEILRALKRVQRGQNPDRWRPRPWAIALATAAAIVALSATVLVLGPHQTGGGDPDDPSRVPPKDPVMSMASTVAYGQSITGGLSWGTGVTLPEDAASTQWTVKDALDSYRVIKFGTGSSLVFEPAAPGQYAIEAKYHSATLAQTLGVYADFAIPPQGIKDSIIQLAPSGKITKRAGVKYSWRILSPTGAEQVLTSDTGRSSLRLSEIGIYRITLQTVISNTEQGQVYVSPTQSIEVSDIPIPAIEAAANPNPSFELLLDGTPAAWFVASPNDVTMSETAFRGQLSLKTTGNADSAEKIMQQFYVPRGEKYRAQVWVKGKGTSGAPPELEIRFRSRTSDSYVAREVKTSQPWSGTYDWQRLVVEFTTPTNSDVALEVRLNFGGKGTVWFDYCVIEPLR